MQIIEIQDKDDWLFVHPIFDRKLEIYLMCYLLFRGCEYGLFHSFSWLSLRPQAPYE
jgi:hypothetical protein